MALQIRAVGGPTNTASSPGSVDKPTGTLEGDLMLLHVGINLDRTPTPPAGWTLIPNTTITGLFNIRCYYKVAGPSEPASYDVSFTSTGTIGLGIITWYSDEDKAIQVDTAASQTNSGTNRIWPSVTAAKAGEGLTCFATIGVNANSTPPAGSDERYDQFSATRMYCMTEVLASAGATGTRTATTAGSGTANCASILVMENDPATGDPTLLSATPASTSQINLAWTDNSSNEDNYEIYHSTNGSGFTLLDTIAANSTSYNHTGLSEHTPHWYKVRAINEDGATGYSNEANTSTLIAAPTGLAATPVSASRIDLSWVDNSSVEDGYKIERSPNGSDWAQIDTVGAGVTAYQSTGLNPDTQYFYRVRAYDGSDNSAYTSTANATTLPATPTGLSANATLSTKIVLTWSDSNTTEDGFKVERSPNGSSGWTQIGTTGANVQTYSDETGLSANTPYYYRVRAYRGSNNSAYSNTATATTFVAMTASSGLSLLVLSATSIQLSWTDTNAIRTGFSVERSANGVSGWAEIATPTASPYSSTGLTQGTTYYYRVRPYRSGSLEYGGYSGVESAATLSSTPVKHMRLFLLKPAIVFQARVNQASFTYPLDQVTYDTVTTGAYTDILVGQTILFGTAAGLDDLGRQRIRSGPSSTVLKIGRSSKGIRDGEVDLSDNMYITVLDDFRIWSKIPYIDSDGAIFKDSEFGFGDQTIEPPPVSNPGPGFAATIDGSDKITVAFDGSASFATADGATITDYGWDLQDGTVIDGAVDEAEVTATFPAGFRWINLTVTDSNGKQMTSHRPIFARDPAEDGQVGWATTYFQIENHRITPAGQQLAVRIRQTIAASNYPDGTLVMLWNGEPSDAEDRSHMVFIGWHQTDPASIQAERTALLKDVTLNCLDVAGRLDTLPGFPQTIENDATPANWTEMFEPNIDRYLHYLLFWHSTALETSDWYWSGTGSDYAFTILGSEGESLYDQVNRRAQSICPDHLLTCNTMGQLFVNPDPMLQDTGDRTATIQATLTDEDYADIRYTNQRPPKVHWLRGSAILADLDEVAAVFCVAPGNSPGQGETAQDHGEQLATSQSSLNAVTGHRYARANAPQGLFTISLAYGDDLNIEPADLTWVRLTISAAAAAQRGLNFTNARGLVKEITIRYAHERTGLVKTVDLQWERETSGNAAVTVVPEEAEPVDDGDDWTPPDPNEDLIPPPAPPSTEQVVGMIDSLGNIFKTSNFQSSPPTWSINTSISSNFPASNEILSFVVDPFSPGYRDLGTAINGWVATEDGIWRLTDLFGTPTATEVFTFADTAVHSLGQWRTIHASFGRFFEDETDNPWIMVASYYNGVPSTPEGTTVVYSQDAGQTWSSEIVVNADYDPDSALLGVGRYPALWLSPRTPGLALTVAFDAANDVSPSNTSTYKTLDWGATWSIQTQADLLTGNPYILTGELMGGCFHVPWADNEDELIVLYGAGNLSPTALNYHLYTTTGTSGGRTIISPTPTPGELWGPQKGLFSIRCYDNDRRYMVLVGRNNAVAGAPDEDQDTAAVFVSSNYGANWTMIYGPHTTAINDRYAVEAAFSANDPNVIFIWESERAVSYTSNFGGSVVDKSGNLAALGGAIEIFRGFFGGPT